MPGELFGVIAPVLVCAALGYALARSGRRIDLDQVTTLVTNVGAPCLAFHTLANLGVPGAAFATMAGAAALALAANAAIGGAVLAAAGLSHRAYLPPLMFPNTGNMGLPLCLLAFGEVGLGFAICMFAVNATSHFTIGVAIASGSVSPRSLVRVPILYAILPAVAFMLTGTRPPDWINNTTELIGGIAIPMMLIALGFSLARLRVRRVPRSLVLAALRLAAGFAIGVTLAWGLGLEGAARGVVIIQCSMPAAVFNYLFALRYGNAPEEVAGIVVLSTLLSFASLPALLWFVLPGAG